MCRNTQTSIDSIKKDGAVVFAKPEALANTGYATDRSGLTLDAIKDFADSIEIERIRELFDRQIRFNMDIASSVPVIVYARETAVPTEKLYRVLTFSRLLTIYQKEFTASCPPSAVRYRHPARRARRSPTLQAARKEPEKVAKAGFTARKSEFVNAPIMNELPLTLECKRIKIIDGDMYLGEIVNAVADERILDADGNIDVKKLDPIVFDMENYACYALGARVGTAFADGK